MTKPYTPEFKKQVVEDIIQNKISYREAELKYSIGHGTVRAWERIYLEEGEEGFKVIRGNESRRKKSIGKAPKLNEKIEKDLIAEVQWLRMENAYLKKLNALVQQKEKSVKRIRQK